MEGVRGLKLASHRSQHRPSKGLKVGLMSSPCLSHLSLWGTCGSSAQRQCLSSSEALCPTGPPCSAFPELWWRCRAAACSPLSAASPGILPPYYASRLPTVHRFVCPTLPSYPFNSSTVAPDGQTNGGSIATSAPGRRVLKLQVQTGSAQKEIRANSPFIFFFHGERFSSSYIKVINLFGNWRHLHWRYKLLSPYSFSPSSLIRSIDL